MNRKRPLVVSRRQILAGVGGYSLGLPFLPSILPGRAFGADPVAATQRRFVAFTSEHGAVLGKNFCPPDTTLTNTMDMYAGHPIRYGQLAPTIADGETQLSGVLRAPSTTLTPQLLAKMNLLRGFDIGYYTGHQQGAHLGNFPNNEGHEPPVIPATPTIDQFMAWSNDFYPTLDGVVQRSLVTGQVATGNISWDFANPAAKTGDVQKIDPQPSSKALFDSMFRNFKQATQAPPPRTPIVNRVIENYRRLAQSNRRLSREDRARLDAHVTLLDELDRKLNTSGGGGMGCNAGPVTGDSGPLDKSLYATPDFFHLVNDVIVAGFACGLSRIATCRVSAIFVNFSGDWHIDVAHQAAVPANQQLLTDSHQQTFQHGILDLAAKLDRIQDAPGRTLLDTTLVQWTQEAGPQTHNVFWMPIVTFGSAGGSMSTGKYVDYRNRSKAAEWTDEYPGVLYRQWLANVLMAMGIPRTAYETSHPGYGEYIMLPNFAAHRVPSVIDKSGNPLPIVTG